MKLQAGARSDPGKRREINEDALYLNAERGVFAVADGLGGHQAGEVASHLAIEVVERFSRNVHSGTSLADLEQAVWTAHRMISEEALTDADRFDMGTTLVLALIKEDRLLLAHVGDSRAYLLGPDGLRRLTDDHSLVFEMLHQGQITEQEARRHPQRSVILQALGKSPSLDVDAREMPFKDGLLLLCSDGLNGMLDDREIEGTLLTAPGPQEACDELVARANEAGGSDNISVVVVVKARRS